MAQHGWYDTLPIRSATRMTVQHKFRSGPMRDSWMVGTLGAVLALCMLGDSCQAGPPEAVKGAAEQWHHWRGPSGQGYVDDTRVPLTWSESENLLWKTPLPGR